MVINKTDDIKDFVNEVLMSIPDPYGEDIIDELFLKVKGDSEYLRTYNQLVDSHTKRVTNQLIGKYTQRITGLNSHERVQATRGNLNRIYTKLRIN